MSDLIRAAAVGPKDIIEIFRVIGFDIFATDNEKPAEVLSSIVDKYRTIVVTEKEYILAGDVVTKYRESPLPEIMPIPNGLENLGVGAQILAENLRAIAGKGEQGDGKGGAWKNM